jgi:hypothetical protein
MEMPIIELACLLVTFKFNLNFFDRLWARGSLGVRFCSSSARLLLPFSSLYSLSTPDLVVWIHHSLVTCYAITILFVPKFL